MKPWSIKKCIFTARLLYYIVISTEARTFGMRSSLSVYEISIPVTTITVIWTEEDFEECYIKHQSIFVVIKNHIKQGCIKNLTQKQLF